MDGSGTYAWIASAVRAACEYDHGEMLETCCRVVVVSGSGTSICCAAMRGDRRRVASRVLGVGGMMGAIMGRFSFASGRISSVLFLVECM